MKERPLLFTGEMVRAILDGRKTQTRRIVKPRLNSIVEECFKVNGKWCNHTFGYELGELCPYGQPGDRLWCRETWRPVGPWEGRKDKATVQYRADEKYSRKTGWPSDFRISARNAGKWKPSIFMPRWASRITLEIVNVSVERLQNISDEDAIAEGVVLGGSRFDSPHCKDEQEYQRLLRIGAKEIYQSLWDSINGKDSWALNPWVWVIKFKQIEVNIEVTKLLHC